MLVDGCFIVQGPELAKKCQEHGANQCKSKPDGQKGTKRKCERKERNTTQKKGTTKHAGRLGLKYCPNCTEE